MKFFQAISQSPRTGKYILWKILDYFKLALWHLFTFWGLGAYSVPNRGRHWTEADAYSKSEPKQDIEYYFMNDCNKIIVLSRKKYIYSL